MAGKRSSTHSRKVSFYPRPQTLSLLDAYMLDNEMSRSKTLDVIVTQFFKGMTVEERQRILKRGEASKGSNHY